MPLAEKKKRKYNYTDYLKWPDDLRCEIIDGTVYDMTPSPSRRHQELLGNLFIQFGNFLKNKKCSVYIAPFDVRLTSSGKNENEITSVVQPDISVICDKKKLDDKGCIGPPDLIVEIISPNTVSKDVKEKFYLYEKHSVKEYWIVHPIDNTVMVFKLGKNSEYGKPQTYTHKDTIKVGVLKGLSIDLMEIFIKN